MKKLILLLGLAISLTACGGETEQSTEQTETVKEEVTNEVVSEKENEEVVSEDQTTNPNILEGKNGTYEFVEDPILVDSIYDENVKILVLPIKYTNTTDEPQDPWVAFVSDFDAKQSDETSTYTLNGGLGEVPEEYEEEIGVEPNPGITVDYYIPLELAVDAPVQLKDWVTGDLIKEIPLP